MFSGPAVSAFVSTKFKRLRNNYSVRLTEEKFVVKINTISNALIFILLELKDILPCE